MTHSRTPVGLSLVAVTSIAATIALSSCSAIDEVVHKVRSEEFATARQLQTDWPREAEWLPSDSTDIQIRESTVADDAVVFAVSGAPLDPALCVVVPRQSAPAYSIDGAPDAYDADEVYACGYWSVIPTGSGWLGWTPNHPNEHAQSPQP